MLLWILTALAQTPEPPTLLVGATFPEGVAPAPVAREMVTGERSADVRFEIVGKPEIRDGDVLVVTGALINGGRKPAKVYLAADPSQGSPFVLGPRGVTWRGTPPSERPAAPHELTLPPGQQVVYQSGLRLSAWEWPADGAEIDWSFRFWTDPASGTLPGKLQPPPRP